MLVQLGSDERREQDQGPDSSVVLPPPVWRPTPQFALAIYLLALQYLTDVPTPSHRHTITKACGYATSLDSCQFPIDFDSGRRRGRCFRGYECPSADRNDGTSQSCDEARYLGRTLEVRSSPFTTRNLKNLHAGQQSSTHSNSVSHKLSRIEQVGIGGPVRVFFENGTSDVGAFVVGCDGLNSNTRKEISGTVKADYTGLTQVCISFCRAVTLIHHTNV